MKSEAVTERVGAAAQYPARAQYGGVFEVQNSQMVQPAPEALRAAVAFAAFLLGEI